MARPFTSVADARKRAGKRPLCLDLFCGAGGSAKGLRDAGFYVVGVDDRPMPRYAGDEFVQADAMTFPLDGYDFIWASPPCQGYSIMRNLPWLRDRDYPRLIEPLIARLSETGAHYVVENVMGARDVLKGGWLCGGMFGLPFFRHRIFASNLLWLSPPHPRHKNTVRNGRTLGSRARDIVHNGARRVGANVGHAAGVQDAREAMGIDWMSRDEITQAIPPVYAEYIGKQVIKALGGTMNTSRRTG